MFTIENNEIHVTRGDILFFDVTAEYGGAPHHFEPGDLVRISVYGKKDCENVVLVKDFPVFENCESVEIFLNKEDTKIGEVISKPNDYWYEVELNPLTAPQTIIGYHVDGPALFRLYPEGADIKSYDPSPEEIPAVDTKLDISSPRPVANSAVAAKLEKIERDSKKDYITPQMFGAVGDGVADDTQALQSCINKAMQTGEPIFIPAGEYVVTDTLCINTLENESWADVKNVRISGATRTRTIIKAKLTDKPVLLFNNVNNGNSSSALCERFIIKAYDSNYLYQYDGIKLVNSVGNIYKEITITHARNGLLLTTHRDTTIFPQNTGYCEQNVFENVSISAVKCIVFNVGENDIMSSYHGNIFENVSLTANSDNTGCRSVALSLESGYIYNCKFNLKTFQSGTDTHLIYINAFSGINTGTITYEDFGGHGVKISTGNYANASFVLEGNVFGLGNINWSEYSPCKVGDIDESGNTVDSSYNKLGINKFACRNIVVPHDFSSVATQKRSYMGMPLFGGKEDIWQGEHQNLIRYRATSGNQESGYIMVCREEPYGASRFILGKLTAPARNLSDLVPGFYFYADGKKVESVSTGNTLEFIEDGGGAKINGGKIRTSADESSNLDYHGHYKMANGLVMIWGAHTLTEEANSVTVDLSTLGLKAIYNCQATPFFDASVGQKNTVGINTFTNTGFKISGDIVGSCLVYWFAIGKEGNT